MTDQRDLKRRIRERMARTGESYTTARAHVLNERPAAPAEPAGPARDDAMEVVEPIDLTALAAQLGLKCDVKMFPSLAAVIDGKAALVQLRDALLATEGDPSTAQFRASVLRGELPPKHGRARADHDELRRFLARAQVGLGGVSPAGNLLALKVDAELIVINLSVTWSPSADTELRPMIWLHAATESAGDVRLAGWRFFAR